MFYGSLICALTYFGPSLAKAAAISRRLRLGPRRYFLQAYQAPGTYYRYRPEAQRQPLQPTP